MSRLLIDLDGGIHSQDDLQRKFKGTIVYGARSETEESRPLYIKEISGGVVYSYEGWKDHYTSSNTNEFCIDHSRPSPGIYNYLHSKRPIKVEYIPERQWKVGWCQENIAVKHVRDVHVNIWNMPLASVKDIYVPWYPTIPEAIELLKAYKFRHLAINSSVSILRANTSNKGFKIIVLKNFIPFMTISNGMLFRIPPVDSMLVKDYKEYGSKILEHTK